MQVGPLLRIASLVLLGVIAMLLSTGCAGQTTAIEVRGLRPAERAAFVACVDRTAQSVGLQRQLSKELTPAYSNIHRDRSFQQRLVSNAAQSPPEMWLDWDPYFSSYTLTFVHRGELEAVARSVGEFALARFGAQRARRFHTSPLLDAAFNSP